MAATRFAIVSATYRVPFVDNPTPVGPSTNAAALVASSNPLAITSSCFIRGGETEKSSPTRTIVPLATLLEYRQRWSTRLVL